MNTRIRLILVFMSSSVVLAMMSSGALAQDYPPDVAFGVACTSAQAGQVVECSVVGAAAGEELMVSAAHGTTVFFTEVLSASAEGEVNFSFTVPADAGDDQIMVTVSGEISGTTTEVLAVAVAVTTPGAPVTTTPALARTGQDLLMVGAIGLVLLMAGVVAVRRRRASASVRDTTRIDV